MEKYFDVKKHLIEKLALFLEPKGFYFLKEIPGHFIKNTSDNRQIRFFLSFNKSTQGISHMNISFLEVEKRLQELSSLPNMCIESVRKQTTFHATISDKQNEDSEKLKLIKYKNVTRETFDEFSNNIIEYLECFGLPFMAKYSNLNAVLSEMNSLNKQGKLWIDLIDNGPEFLFRGLLISKLCNDPDFDNKSTFVRKTIIENLTEEGWIEAYKELQEILKNTTQQQRTELKNKQF